MKYLKILAFITFVSTMIVDHAHADVQPITGQDAKVLADLLKKHRMAGGNRIWQPGDVAAVFELNCWGQKSLTQCEGFGQSSDLGANDYQTNDPSEVGILSAALRRMGFGQTDPKSSGGTHIPIRSGASHWIVCNENHPTGMACHSEE